MSLSACATQADIDRISTNPDLEKLANVVELAVEVDSTLAQAWKLVATDFDKSELFNNNAESTFYLNDSKKKIGAKRRTKMSNKKFIDVEIISFDPTTHYIAWEIVATNVIPMKVAFSSYKITAVSNSKVIISQRAGFKLKNPVMDFIGKLRFHNIFLDELATVKYVLETNKAKSTLSKKQRKKEYYPAVDVNKHY